MVAIVELIADMLAQYGIDHIFGLPGGVAPFLFEEFFKRPEQFRTITARHEGAAAVMADVYGRLTHKPGVVIGQGLWMATNGGFGIAEAFLAGSPMLVLTEFSDWYGVNQHAPYQIGTGEYGSIDLVNIYKSYSKFVTTANSPGELLYGIQLAIKHAISGKPGPAVVISKWNIMLAQVEDASIIQPPLFPLQGYLRINPPCISQSDAQKIAHILIEAIHPIMICGRGVHSAGAYDEVRQLAELVGIPVATSYMGKGSLPEIHDLALGSMAGLGQKLANDQIEHADVVLVVGSCLAPENTNNCCIEFLNPFQQKLIQIDIESRHAGWTYPVYLGVTSDAKLALQEIIKAITKDPSYAQLATQVSARINATRILKAMPEWEWFFSKFFTDNELPIAPERVVKEINDLISPNDLLFLDGGNNRMWFTKLFQTKAPGQLIGPGGAAGMAWCSSAVLAASMLHKKGRVIGAIGDGGLLMALYNFETIKQYNLDLALIVFNNSCLGNVRDFLSRKGQGLCDYEQVNFARIAQTMGIEGIRVDTIEELHPALERAIKSKGVVIVDVNVKPASHMRVKSG